MPPPVQIGERLEPARARPVPFWRHGLAPPPRTLPRGLGQWGPWRGAASPGPADSRTRGPLNGAPNAASSSLTFAEAGPPSLRASAIGPHLHDAVAAAGYGAAQ